MRPHRLLKDLWSAAWLVIAGALGAVLTVAAIVSAIAGAHVATPWLIVGVLTVALVIVCTAYVKAANARDAVARTSATGVPSPNPMTVLRWDGHDYQPQEAKAWRGPKMFFGPTDPGKVPGVVHAEGDMWVQVPS